MPDGFNCARLVYGRSWRDATTALKAPNVPDSCTIPADIYGIVEIKGNNSSYYRIGGRTRDLAEACRLDRSIPRVAGNEYQQETGNQKKRNDP
jgi:hypothetical protein